MGIVWKLLIANITAIYVVFAQALQQQPEEKIPHAESLVPVLWSLIGVLALVISIMLRLWYKDFTDWRGKISGQLERLQTSSDRWDEAKKDIHERLERIEQYCNPQGTKPPQRRKR